MLQAAPKFIFKIFIVSVLIQFFFPSIPNRFSVRTISPKRGLFVTLSKSSPPVAALEDAQIDFSDKPEPASIKLEPIITNVRVLPGIRLSQRELGNPIAKPEIKAEPRTIVVTPNEPIEQPPRQFQVMNTQEYSEPRKPRVINFQALMNKVRAESTGSEAKASDKADGATQEIVWTPPKPKQPQNQTTTSTDVPKNNYTDASYDVSGSVTVSGNHPSGSKIVIYRQVNGVTQESTGADGTNGFRFKTRLATGVLVGQLRSSDDQVIAEGERSFDEIFKGSRTIANVTLNLVPRSTFTTTGGAYPAGADKYTHTPISGVSISATSLHANATNQKGKFELGPTMPESSMIVKAEKKGFFNTMMLASQNQSLNVQMYPEDMVKGLIDMVGGKGFSLKDFESSGIVWGRVSSQQGETVENVKVEITDSQAIGPIYFNDFFLPDPKREVTSSNGIFVFLHVLPGTAVVRANQNGHMMPSRLVPVEPKYVSQVELEGAKKQKAVITTFEAFSKAPVMAEVRFAGMSHTAKTNPLGQIETSYARNSDPLILEVDPKGELMSIRYHTSRSGNHIEIPQISQEWFNSLKLNQGPEFGSIIGFVSGQRYDVFMDINNKPHEEIYYFNANGEIVPVPVAGGGFVIANVPIGLRTVSIVPEGSPAIFSQVVSVDNSFVAVMSKQF